MGLRWPLVVFVTLALTWTSTVSATDSQSIHSQCVLSDLDPKSIKDKQDQYAKLGKAYTGSAVRINLALRHQNPPESSMPRVRRRTTKRQVQEWNMIPNFLAWGIKTLSRQPIIIAGNTQEKVTVVVTAYIIPPDGRVSYPSKPTGSNAESESESESAAEEHRHSNLQLEPSTFKMPKVPVFLGGPGIEKYPKLRVAPIEAPGWGSGTAVWSHILRSLKAVAKDTLDDVDAEHFTLIERIAEANPEHSQMLYTKHAVDPRNKDLMITIGYMLLTGDEKRKLDNVQLSKRPLYLNGLQKTLSS